MVVDGQNGMRRRVKVDVRNLEGCERATEAAGGSSRCCLRTEPKPALARALVGEPPDACCFRNRRFSRPHFSLSLSPTSVRRRLSFTRPSPDRYEQYPRRETPGRHQSRFVPPRTCLAVYPGFAPASLTARQRFSSRTSATRSLQKSCLICSASLGLFGTLRTRARPL